jgi:hypothetical protein
LTHEKPQFEKQRSDQIFEAISKKHGESLIQNSKAQKAIKKTINEIVKKSIEIQEATCFNNKRFKDIKV